jgi:hypothetical protein
LLHPSDLLHHRDINLEPRPQTFQLDLKSKSAPHFARRIFSTQANLAVQLIEPRLGVTQVVGVEALGEPF